MSPLRASCAVLLLVGCGGAAVTGSSLGPPSATAMCASAPVTATEANSVASLGENIDATCASVGHVLTWQMEKAGAACTSPIDCTPACVPCPIGPAHALSAWCDHGACATPAGVACMVAGTLLKSCGDTSSSASCLYNGVEHQPGEQWTAGCLLCSCGVPGAKSQGIQCMMTACADGSVDANDAATELDSRSEAIAR